MDPSLQQRWLLWIKECNRSWSSPVWYCQETHLSQIYAAKHKKMYKEHSVDKGFLLDRLSSKTGLRNGRASYLTWWELPKQARHCVKTAWSSSSSWVRRSLTSPGESSHRLASIQSSTQTYNCTCLLSWTLHLRQRPSSRAMYFCLCSRRAAYSVSKTVPYFNSFLHSFSTPFGAG